MKVLKKIKEEQARVAGAVKEKTMGYILAGLGFVAGLAWNEAIKSLIDQFFPNSGGSVFLKFCYALFITIFVVVITVYLLRNDEQVKK